MKELIYVAPSNLDWREGLDPVLAAPDAFAAHAGKVVVARPRLFSEGAVG
jgi:hypothetical protein